MSEEKMSREDLIREIDVLRRRVAELEEAVKKQGKNSTGRRGSDSGRGRKSGPSGVFTERNGVMEYVDPVFCEVRVPGFEELLGRGPGMTMQGKRPQGGPWRGRPGKKGKKGEIYWEEATVSALTDSSGNVIHFLAVKKDRAPWKNAEEALRSSAGRYRALFTDSPIALIEYEYGELHSYFEELRAGGVTDFEKYFRENPAELQVCASKIRVTDANRAAIELFRSADRIGLIGDVERVFSTTSYDSFREALIVVASGGSEYEAETTIKPLAGEVRDVFMRLRVVSGEAGEYRAIVATMDIMRRKRAERELEKSRERLREAESVARLGYYVFNVKTGRWSSSAILDEIFGIDEGYERDVAGWLRILHPAFRKEMRSYLESEVLGRHQRFDREYRVINQRTGESRWVHGLGSLKVDEDSGEVLEVFGTVQDVTERKRAELEARREMEVTKNLLRLSEATFRLSDIEELMKNVAAITRDILKVDQVMTYIWDAEAKALRPSESAGLKRERSALPDHAAEAGPAGSSRGNGHWPGLHRLGPP